MNTKSKQVVFPLMLLVAGFFIISRETLQTRVSQVHTDLQLMIEDPQRQGMGKLEAKEFMAHWNRLISELRTDDVVRLYRDRYGS